MPTRTDAAYAAEMDAADELAHFRDRFAIMDPELIYLDGNSLGRLPMATAALAEEVIHKQWGDRLIRGGMRVVTVRKLMQTISFGSVALAMLAVAQIETAPLAIAVMCVSSALGAASGAGFGTNHLDIAPRHAGVLMGLSNTAGTLPGVVGVLISGWIVQTTGSWVLVFQLAAAVKIFGLLYFLAFAKGEKEFD